jgi:hypothetical protein
MVELQLILDFACCHCEQSVSVTVKCAGKGLTANTRAVATVQVPCPTCGQTSQLYFEPSGTVRDVFPARTSRRLEPSIN